MVIGKIVTKVIQSLPTWEMTKYYGRVGLFQLKCLKYRIQTSEAWFNFKCKFLPGSLHEASECEEVIQKQELPKKQKVQSEKASPQAMPHRQESKCQYQAEEEEKTSISSYKNMNDTYVTEDYAKDSKRTQENQPYQQSQKKHRKMKQYQR